jgi:hypothetical protein
VSGRDAAPPGLEPDAAFARFVYKLRRDGLGYLRYRLRWEAALPTTWPGKAAHAVMRSALAAALTPIRALRGAAADAAPGAAETLYAFYDLKVAPITYDILWFLAAADLERRRLGLARVHVVIVPGPYQGAREEEPSYELVVDAEARRWRIDNILVPACRLLPSCTSLTLAGTRADAAFVRSRLAHHVYPSATRRRCSGAPPQALPGPAEAGVRPIGAAREPGGAGLYRPLAGAAPGRAAAGRSRCGTIPTTPPATATSPPGPSSRAGSTRCCIFRCSSSTPSARSTCLPPWRTSRFRTISWNLSLRMALYERAWLNLRGQHRPHGALLAQ